ncbi:MAG: D-methionine transport system ATP-binding protein [Kosmotogales bacterium]|nr:D-methionine transport system ATP-binding protein [Kosmotogales bacterium]
MNIVSVENLNLTYEEKGNKNHILKDISFEVEKGEILGIVGLSGAGKTSLLRTLNLLHKPDNGKIIFEQEDITKLNEKTVIPIRKKIGVVFQHFNLFRNKNVYNNIAFPLLLEKIDKEEIKKRVEKIADEIGLTERLNAYPSQLSGGEQQRVGIARSIITNPDLILLDEPTSALDPMITKIILDLVLDISIKRGLTIITVTHDMDVVKRICDKVAYLKKGTLSFFGETHEFFASLTTKEVSEFENEFLTDFEKIKKRESDEKKFIRVVFWGANTHESVIWDTAKDMDINVNILYGKIEELKKGPFGSLILEISGKQSMNFIKNLKEKVYYLEVI